MSEKNMTEKLADSITKLIKKTHTFEKVETLLKGVSLFMFITGAVTLYNSYKLHKMTSHLNLSKNKMEDRINTKLDKIILLIKNNIQQNNNDFLTPPIPLIENIVPKIENNKIGDNDDDEILNECYDNIPCNNSKKASGLNRLFGWK
jgi:hypothetical protein